jgi:hypothetical protein
VAASSRLRFIGEYYWGIQITDEFGRRYEPVQTTKAGKRYRYYVSRKKGDVGQERKQGRLPADALEQQVADRLATYLGSPDEILTTLASDDDDAFCRERLLDSAKRLAATYESAAADWTLYRASLQQIVVRPACVDLVLDQQAVRQWLGESESTEAPSPVTLTIPVRLYRTGHDLRLVVNNGPEANEAGSCDNALIKLIARGRRWYEQLTSGEISSIREIAKAEGLDERYVARILYSALLAPDIIEKVVQGRQPVQFTLKSLKRSPPLNWDEQRRQFGMPR